MTGRRGYAAAMRIVAVDGSAAESVVRLWHVAGLTRPWNDPHADFARAVRGPGSAVLGGYDRSGELLATAMVGHDGHRGWIYYLAVTQSHRGQGLARQLVHACEDWVRGHGVPKVQLMVRRDNSVAVGLYERLGYEESDVQVLGRWLDEGPAGDRST